MCLISEFLLILGLETEDSGWPHTHPHACTHSSDIHPIGTHECSFIYLYSVFLGYLMSLFILKGKPVCRFLFVSDLRVDGLQQL